MLCKRRAFRLERLHNGTEIRSDAYQVSSFDLDPIPSLEQDKMTISLIQFRPYLPVNRGFVLVITRYPEIFRGHCSLADIRHDSLKIVLDGGDG